MPNKEHVTLLKQGVDTWNAWRDENPDLCPDFNGVDLHGADLRDANLAAADLSGADLEDTNLCRTFLFTANLSGANLRGANLHLADLREADVRGANLETADVRGADLETANFEKANLTAAILGGVNLRGANLNDVNLRRAMLITADLEAVSLRWAKLEAADLTEAKLYGADLTEANLKEANLTGAWLGATNLRDAKLIGAKLPGAGLREASLIGANLEAADLHGAEFEGTLFVNTTLRNAKGLESCTHHGPSFIDYRTLQKSGILPVSFLRGCGLPNNLIDYLPSLLNAPIQFYSCFISYSNRDEDFVYRLHADLQDKGVRCWFAPEDMKIGDKIRTRIDEVIRIHEKLLLVLSNNSINSEWVEKEVETAFEREREMSKTVLFPVRLDDSVMNRKTGWAADIKRTRHIGDFRNWKDHDTYQRGLERLLRDLQMQQERETNTGTQP